MTLPLPFPFMLGFLSCETPMMLRLKCGPLGAPLPVAFCAAAMVVVASVAATAAARWNVKRMSPPSNRSTYGRKHQAPSATSRARRGLLEPCGFTARGHYRPCVTARGVRCLTTVVAICRGLGAVYRPTLWVTRHARRRLVL